MIQTDSVSFPVAAITHPGMSGKNNEDRYGVTGFQLTNSDKTPVLLAVLSDGIGGHRAGEVAAQIAVDEVARYIAANPVDQPTIVLQQAVVAASQAIHVASNEDPARQGMGATVAVVLIIGRRLYAVSVGDSRIYLMRGSAIRQISIDHTWIQEALDMGVLTPEEAKGHPNAHVIRRYLGSPNPPDVDQRILLSSTETDSQAVDNQGFLLKPGDRLLLCSDGLTDLVENDEIFQTFQDIDQNNALHNLVDLANQRGGHDNITIITIEIPQWVKAAMPTVATPPMARAKPVQSPIVRLALAGCLATVAIALIIAAAVLGINLFGNRPGPTTETPIVSNNPGGGILPFPTVESTATLEPLPTMTYTATFLPISGIEDGATLTPWPTNTFPPVPTATSSPTPTP